MGYYVRVLGIQDPNIHIDELLENLDASGLSANLAYAEGEQSGEWTILQVANKDGEPLTQIERNPVIEGGLGKEELDEFREMIQDFRPKSAVEWLSTYFANIKVIYALQILHAAFEDDNFEIINSIKATIWNKTGGIMQADQEGFTNEAGYHILWQFDDSVEGEWDCAVNNLFGNWQKFRMDLGDKKQRLEFQDGKVPKNATIL